MKYQLATTDQKELRPLLHAEVDKLRDENLLVLHRVALELELEEVTNRLTDGFDADRAAGKLPRLPESKKATTKAPWPKSLADRVTAVECALREVGAPVTASTLVRRFLRAKPADLAEIPETLATLGRAHRSGETFSI